MRESIKKIFKPYTEKYYVVKLVFKLWVVKLKIKGIFEIKSKNIDKFKNIKVLYFVQKWPKSNKNVFSSFQYCVEFHVFLSISRNVDFFNCRS